MKYINYFLSLKNKLLKMYLDIFLFKQNILNLNLLFENLSEYEYIIIKLDTPYMTKDFPKIIPIGKDLDIYSSKKDFENVNESILNFANQYQDIFDIKIIKDDGKYRVRFEKFGQLYYQLDNNYLTDKTIPSVFIEDAICHKIRKNNYYTLPIEYEIVFRLSEIKNAPHKRYHIDFVKMHITKVVYELIPPKLIPLYLEIKEGKL